MRLDTLQIEQYNEFKNLFLDTFSNAPWYDHWEDENQLDQYLHELTDNKNSLSLVLLDDEGHILGASLGYCYSWWEGSEYFIKEFFIARDKQKQGYGSVFMSLIQDYSKENELKAICLNTHKEVEAYDFYHKNGFKEVDGFVLLAKDID